MTCHFSVGGAQGTLSTPYLVTCHFSVGGTQGILSTPYLVTCHFSVGGTQGILSTPYLVTCHFSVGGTQGILSTPLLDFISNFQKPPMWSSYWLWSLEQPRQCFKIMTFPLGLASWHCLDRTAFLDPFGVNPWFISWCNASNHGCNIR